MKKPNYPKRVASKSHMVTITLIMLVVATVCFHNWMHADGPEQYFWMGGYIGAVIGTVKEYVFRSRYKKAKKGGWV